MSDSIQSRYLQVLEKIEIACTKSGRQSQEVTLVVVTKGQSVAKINEVVNAGAINLGENYPEETHKKILDLGSLIHPTWHMIGHLQSRKIRLMHPYFQMIHSLDSIELAGKLNRFYEAQSCSCNVLVEINLGGELSKYGFDCQSIQKQQYFVDIFEQLIGYKNLKILGLMTMPPYSVLGNENEAYFERCRELQKKIKGKYCLPKFDQLSMGTSSDYETAIKCGATFVRVGEAIMGERSYI